MKRKYLLAVLIAAAMPLTSMAQDDDLYFNPKKEAKEKAERRALLQRQYAEQRARRDSVYRLFWSGSDRSVDEYNRGGRIFSHYENVGKDSLGNDIIQFHVGKGVAPDSIYDDAYFAQKYADRDEDFVRTREMSRWDGFYDPWFYNYFFPFLSSIFLIPNHHQSSGRRLPKEPFSDYIIIWMQKYCLSLCKNTEFP
jgi:hypothetical protein